MLSPTRDADLAVDGGPPVRSRPFAPACFLSGDERELLLECLESQQWSSFRAGTPGPEIIDWPVCPRRSSINYGPLEARFVGGKYVRRLECLFARYTKTRFAVSANSATSGLVMALGAIDLNPGDEVLVPCMSFHSTATSVLFFNAVPVFTEVKPDTYCIDPADAEARSPTIPGRSSSSTSAATPPTWTRSWPLARKHSLKGDRGLCPGSGCDLPRPARRLHRGRGRFFADRDQEHHLRRRRARW